jgi:hypothetical protein
MTYDSTLTVSREISNIIRKFVDERGLEVIHVDNRKSKKDNTRTLKFKFPSYTHPRHIKNLKDRVRRAADKINYSSRDVYISHGSLKTDNFRLYTATFVEV